VQAGSTALRNFGGESIPYWATEDGKGRFIMSMTVLVVVAPLCLVKQLRQVGIVPSFFFNRMEIGSSVQIILVASYAPMMERSSARFQVRSVNVGSGGNDRHAPSGHSPFLLFPREPNDCSYKRCYSSSIPGLLILHLLSSFESLNCS
jgi:hypothetical protein